MIGLLTRSYHDPEFFNHVILGRLPYHEAQKQWCRDVVTYRTLAIETGNMTGKDYFVGGIVPWWLWTRKDSLVVVTGPGQSILGSVTWKEIRKAIDGSPFPMGGRISTGIKTSPHTVILGAGWQALGFSTTSVERASGQHAGNLLVIAEEASGIEDETWQAIDSLGYKKLLAIGNPLKAIGGFVDLCNLAGSDKARGVPVREAACHRNVPSTESPHATWEKSPFGLADRTWLEACERKYGRESLWYRCHVLAIRPTLANERLIPDADIDRCIADATEALVTALRAAGKGGKRRMGCDVGEGCGNSRTVIPVRDDLGVLEIHASRFTGPVAAAEWVARLQSKWQVKEADCSYDGAGQTGKKMGNALYRYGLRGARPYFGAESGGKRCTNLRTATALALARRLDPGHYAPGGPFVPFHIPASEHWPAIREEMQELRYTLSGDKSKLEDKDSLMERLGRSPDFIDALCQTWKEEAIDG